MTALVTVPKDGTSSDVLAQRYRVAFDKMEGSRAQWIERTLEFSAVALEARELYPSNQDLNRWITHNQLQHIPTAIFAAYVGIGRMARKNPATARKLMEDNYGLAVRTIWEKKSKEPAAALSSKGITQPRPVSRRTMRERRIPDVMREDNPPKPERKGVVLKALTPKEVDPDFVGTPLEFTTKYGHVLLQTKEQIEYNKRQEALMAWIGTVTEFERAGRAMLAALPSVDPATLKEWMAKPGKADKINAWSKSVQVACEALYNMISNV